MDQPDAPESAADGTQAGLAAVAVAQQAPPPKALIVLASGFLRSCEGQVNVDVCSFPHLDLCAREGSVGLLASRSFENAGGLARP